MTLFIPGPLLKKLCQSQKFFSKSDYFLKKNSFSFSSFDHVYDKLTIMTISDKSIIASLKLIISSLKL